MEEKLEDYVRVNIDGSGEVTAQITFTEEELFHSPWRGADWYDCQDVQRHLDTESSIANKLGYAADAVHDISSTQEFRSAKTRIISFETARQRNELPF